MIVRIAEIEVVAERLEAYRALLAEEIEAAVQCEPGVLFLFAVALKDRPGAVRLIEGYADHAAYQDHLQTPHFLAYKARTADMVTSLRLVETDPLLLRAKAPPTPRQATHGSRGAILVARGGLRASRPEPRTWR